MKFKKILKIILILSLLIIASCKNNKTNLPYEVIGKVFDKYIESDLEVTIYEGKIDIELFEYKRKQCLGVISK